MAKKQKEKPIKNIFIIGPLPKGIDSTLAVPSLFSKKGKKEVKKEKGVFIDF